MLLFIIVFTSVITVGEGDDAMVNKVSNVLGFVKNFFENICVNLTTDALFA